MSTMRASLIIEARDKASAVFGKIAAKSKDMGKAFQPITKEAKQAERAMDGAGRSAQTMARRLAIAEKAGLGLGKAIGWTGRAVLGMAKWGAIGLGAGAAGGLAFLVRGVVETGMKFEQFQAQLEGTEGSAAGAKRALDWVSKFAATTPYELDQVTEAFVRARNLGIDPYNGALMSLGDAASGTNKTLMEAVEALADAQTFQYERLREFGITSSSKGNQVTFSFIDKGGKSAMKTVKKDAKEIEKALLAIWDGKYAGGMIRQSRTLAGLWSNIKDAGTQFLYKIAQGGIFDKIKNGAADFLGMLNKAADDGSMERWANRVSDALEDMWDWGYAFVRGIDWKQTGSDIRDVAAGAWTVMKFLAAAVGWAVKLKNAIDDAVIAWTLLNGTPQARINASNIIAARQSAAANAGAISRWDKGTGKPAGKVPVNKLNAQSLMPTKVGGVLDINIKAAPGLDATPSKMKTANNNVPIRANVGKVQAA